MFATVSRSAPPEPMEVFSSALGVALDQIRLRVAPATELEEMYRLLESFSLSTTEFGLARTRLQHATRYLRSREWGAAHWELRTLWTEVTRSLGIGGKADPEPTAIPPARRLAQTTRFVATLAAPGVCDGSKGTRQPAQ